MAESTLTFDEKVEGWTSFHSFVPEYMTNLNNDFYTFKNGQLYKHNVENVGRNTYYGQSYNTEVEVSSNASPSDVKIFKTIEIEGNSDEWDISVITNLDRGHIKGIPTNPGEKSSFEEKEGFYSAYIRRDQADEINTELLSVQGIGNLLQPATSNTNAIFSFNRVPGSVNIGDVLFRSVEDTYERVGVITDKTGTSLTIGQATILGTAQDFLFASKSPIAESYGLKGYFASIRLVNKSTNTIELYSVNSEISKSYR